MVRIAISGPESSGKTTTAKMLAKHYDGCFVEEYARKYLTENKLAGHYTMSDLIEIAQHQYLMNKGRECQKQLLVCDTEMTVIKIWAADKFAYIPGEIVTLLERQEFDFIFLCKPDMPWEADPLREDRDRREELFRAYAEELFLNDEDFTVLEGRPENRLQKAVKIIDKLLEKQ